jgi:hypothetical protein
MSPQERAKADIYEMNMACARGLPDTGDMDEARCDQEIQRLTDFARLYTERNWHLFKGDPQHFHGSEARYKLFGLVRGLQKHEGIRYNPKKTAKDAVFTSADSFLYGLLQTHLGTCANLPLLYVAIGRRLGYPLKLVACRGEPWGHLFFRWDDGKEYLNVETTTGGLAYPPDYHYCSGEYYRSPIGLARGRLMISMTPEDELHDFLVERALTWEGLGNHREAMLTYVWAKAVQPLNGWVDNNILRLFPAWVGKLYSLKPFGFPDEFYCLWPESRVFPGVPLEFERALLCARELENLLTDPEHRRKWWEPLQSSSQWVSVIHTIPRKFCATFLPDGSCKLGINERPLSLPDRFSDAEYRCTGRESLLWDHLRLPTVEEYHRSPLDWPW